MATIDGFQLEETLKDFRFNELGGISILKKWRELAVICQIDIEIVSISRENYRNYASIPANGFYGYCTLILRDHALTPIKITQPRQTMYIARNDSAMSNWFTYLQQVRAQENYKGIENLICFNTGLLGGACAPKPCKDLPKFSFDEIPLREVMVKADYGTQFVIEYSFWKMNDELSACGDIITPKSNQTDGSKDSGLPSNGSSPQNGSPNNPYGGLPSADGTDKEGVLSPSKLNNQNNSDPDNSPLTATSPVTWTIRTSVSPPNANDGCGVFRPAEYIFTYDGLYGDSWNFPDCNPRSGYNGFCLYQNGVLKSEAYICSPSILSFESITPIKRII